MDLRGAVALVTGGNGGLGQRICHALAKEGAHIAVMYAQSRDQAEGVARELTSGYQINAAAFACDITDAAAVERLIGDVTKRFGRLDILINDAKLQQGDPVHRSRQSLQSSDGRDVDHAASALGFHDGRHGLGKAHRSEQG